MKKILISSNYSDSIIFQATKYLFRKLEKAFKVMVVDSSIPVHDYGNAYLDFKPDVVLGIGCIPYKHESSVPVIVWDYYGNFYKGADFADTCDTLIFSNRDIEAAKSIKKKGINVKRLYPIYNLHKVNNKENIRIYDVTIYLNFQYKNKKIIRRYMRLMSYISLITNNNIYDDFKIFSNISFNYYVNIKVEDLYNNLINSKTLFICNDNDSGFNYPLLFMASLLKVPVISNNIKGLEFKDIINYNNLELDQIPYDINVKMYEQSLLQLIASIESKVDDTVTVDKLIEIINGHM